METHVSGRLTFLKQLSVLGAVGFPGALLEGPPERSRPKPPSREMVKQFIARQLKALE